MRYLVLAIGIVLAAPAAAYDFRYTHLGVTLGEIDFEEDEFVDSLAGIGLTGGYHWGPGFFEASVQSYSDDVGAAEAEVTESVAGIGNSVSLGPYLDVAPIFGVISREAEFCLGAICEDESETSVMAALRVRAWIVPGSTELSLQGRASEFDPTFTAGLHQKIVGPQHRVGIAYTHEEDFAQYELAYTYRWP